MTKTVILICTVMYTRIQSNCMNFVFTWYHCRISPVASNSFAVGLHDGCTCINNIICSSYILQLNSCMNTKVVKPIQLHVYLNILFECIKCNDLFISQLKQCSYSVVDCWHNIGNTCYAFVMSLYLIQVQTNNLYSCSNNYYYYSSNALYKEKPMAGGKGLILQCCCIVMCLQCKNENPSACLLALFDMLILSCVCFDQNGI